MKFKTFRIIKATPSSNLVVAAQIQDNRTENNHEGNDILKFDLHVHSYQTNKNIQFVIKITVIQNSINSGIWKAKKFNIIYM